MEKLEVDWARVEREWNEGLPPRTPDDVSRALDGTPLDSEAAIIRHMAGLEEREIITHTGRMFRDLLVVLDRDGEEAMIAEMHRLYGAPTP